MNQYTYDGPVMNFGTCISDQWLEEHKLGGG